MNYCVEGYFSKFLSLSQGDINGLRDLYKVTVYSSESSTTCNKLQVGVPGTVVSRLQTKPWYTNLGKNESSVSVIKVIVETGPHKGKQGWMFSNVTSSASFDAQDCKKFDPNTMPFKVPFRQKNGTEP